MSSSVVLAPLLETPERSARAAMRTLLRELGALSRLAGPAVLTQLGLMLMGVVDTLMLSRSA